jgi:RHS repeat-associated protein
MTSDAVTLATGNPQNVDNSVLRREISFNTQGNLYQLTTYNAASSGSVVNQIQRAYNNFGQLITEYQEHSGGVNTSTSTKVQYAYTETTSGAVNNSRLTSMTYPNGRILRYEYSSGLDSDISRLSFLADDSSGSVGTHLEEYSYLGLGGTIKRAHPQPGVDLTYIKQGVESNGDAGDQYTGLDRFGRIVDQRWIVTSGGTHTDRFQYAYDRDSNRLYKNNLVASAQSELYHANGSSAGYDSLNRLTDFERGTLSASGSVLDTVSSASHSIDWSLDALGNMASVTTDGGSAATRTHNSQNQITAVGGNSPTYDNNGSLTNDGNQSYIYDAWNMLVTVKNAAGSSTIISYDAAYRRIHESPTSGTASEQYYSIAWQVLEEKESGSAKRQYVWSPVYIDAMILRDRDANVTGGDGLQSLGLEERLYAQQDANYNLTAAIDTSGSVQERYLFDPYGARSIFDSSYSSRVSSSFAWLHGHQGLKHDGETGLIYNRKRMVVPSFSRFLQKDPLGYYDGPNSYQYLKSSSATSRDPTGLCVPGTFKGEPEIKVTPGLNNPDELEMKEDLIKLAGDVDRLEKVLAAIETVGVGAAAKLSPEFLEDLAATLAKDGVFLSDPDAETIAEHLLNQQLEASKGSQGVAVYYRLVTYECMCGWTGHYWKQIGATPWCQWTRGSDGIDGLYDKGDQLTAVEELLEKLDAVGATW